MPQYSNSENNEKAQEVSLAGKEPLGEKDPILANAPLVDPLVEKLFDDKLEILELLGMGGHGAVYKAYHRLLDTTVAIKILAPNTMDSESAEARFKNEANLLSTFSHENIVRFHSFGLTSDKRHYMVLEFLEGKTLATLLQEKFTLECDQALNYFIQICQGLVYAHEKGVIHRDLKPANIMICADGKTVKLLDFGIFKSLEAEKQGLTKTGTFIGSANYMSPEQCKQEPLDPRSDLYSFACLAYETLVGKPPMDDANEMLIMSNHVNKDILSIPAKHGISRELQKLLLHCMKKRPAERIESAEKLLLELKACKVEGAALKKSPPIPLWTIILAVLGISVLLAGTYNYRYDKNDSKASNQELKRILSPRELDEKIKSFLPLTLATFADAKTLLEGYTPKEADAPIMADLYYKCALFAATTGQNRKIPGEEKIFRLFAAHRQKTMRMSSVPTKNWLDTQTLYIHFLASSERADAAMDEVRTLLEKYGENEVECCRVISGLLFLAKQMKLDEYRQKLLSTFEHYAKQSNSPAVQAAAACEQASYFADQDQDELAKKYTGNLFPIFEQACKSAPIIDLAHVGVCLALFNRYGFYDESCKLYELIRNSTLSSYLSDETKAGDVIIFLIQYNAAEAFYKRHSYETAEKICSDTIENYLADKSQAIAGNSHCDELAFLLLECKAAIASKSKFKNMQKYLIKEAIGYVDHLKHKIEVGPSNQFSKTDNAIYKMSCFLASQDINPLPLNTNETDELSYLYSLCKKLRASTNKTERKIQTQATLLFVNRCIELDKPVKARKELNNLIEDISKSEVEAGKESIRKILSASARINTKGLAEKHRKLLSGFLK